MTKPATNTVSYPAADDISRSLPATGTARRWAIWSAQSALGGQPCFATECRFSCKDTDCPWRDECLGLRAEWHR